MWTELMEKKWAILAVKKLHISTIFGLHLELGFSFWKIFWTAVGLGQLKIEDWIWIAKFDSPLIPAVNQRQWQS